MTAFQQADHPELRRSATKAYRRALKWGCIPVPAACEICGDRGRLVGHHDDYGKALQVRFLCRPCHARVHWGARN